MVDLDLKLKGMDAKIVCTMHMVKIDEIFVEAKTEITETVALILKETMEEAGRALLKIVPVEAEVVIAVSWAERCLVFQSPRMNESNTLESRKALVLFLAPV